MEAYRWCRYKLHCPKLVEGFERLNNGLKKDLTV
jgi:hypothetical protein